MMYSKNLHGKPTRRQRDAEVGLCRPHQEDTIVIGVPRGGAAEHISSIVARILGGILERKLQDLRNDAEANCRSLVENNWTSIERLADCLRLFGKVNGNFAMCCLEGNEGHQLVRNILETVSTPTAEPDEWTRNTLAEYKRAKLEVGPTTDEEKAVWEAMIQKPIDSLT